MVSRDTLVHVLALLIAAGILVTVEVLDVVPDTGTATVAALLLFYGISLGGAHCYLALRKNDGMVPVKSRWRYVTMLAVLLVTGGAIYVAGDGTVGDIAVSDVGLVVILITLVVYLYSESRAGFQATLASE